MESDVGVAYANYDRFDDSGRTTRGPSWGDPPGTWGMPYDPDRLLGDLNCYVGPAFLVRADVWRETGELRGRNSCDYDHWLRIEETCRRRGLRWVYHKGVLCHYYSGNERATVARKHEYDADRWQREARERRAKNGSGGEKYVEEFWDEVHGKASVLHLGNTPASRYTEYFSQAGPFEEDLAAAASVIDIGPGFYNYLASLEGKERHAVDVSEVSREKGRAMGVEVYAPGEVGADVSDLATCLSVVQHCDRGAVETIMSDAYRALRPGGRFYLNGVDGSRNGTPPEVLLRKGKFGYAPDEACAMAEEAGFGVHRKHVYKLGPLGVWILCLEKPS
jgi:hypothetical protein